MHGRMFKGEKREWQQLPVNTQHSLLPPGSAQTSTNHLDLVHVWGALINRRQL